MINLIIASHFVLNLFVKSNLKQVANYSISDYGNPKFEEFSFWINDKNEPVINYYYGKNGKEAKVKYPGKSKIGNVICFKMILNDNVTLYVSQEKKKLRVKDLRGNYNKLFSWMYEGPINGVGTFCEQCTAGENESKKFLNRFYF